MILHFAHFLRDELSRDTGHDCEVHALAFVSLNGRKPELLINPNVNLAREPRGNYQRSWILNQKQPLKWPPSDLAPAQWKDQVMLPKLKHLKVGGTERAKRSNAVQRRTS